MSENNVNPGYSQDPYQAGQTPLPPVAPSAGQQGSYGSPPPQPMWMPKTNENAIIALVWAALAWVACPVIFAIIALVTASKAQKEIDVSNGWSTGAGYVKAAKIVAWVNIAFTVSLVVFYVAIVVIAIGSSQFVTT